MNGDNGTYSGVQHIPKENKKFKIIRNITTNIYKTHAYNSIMFGYFCIKFINLNLKGRSLIEYTNLFSIYKNDKMIQTKSIR